MALPHHLQTQTPTSQQKQPLRLAHRQQIQRLLRLWHHGLRPEYPPLNQACRPLASEPQPPWAPQPPEQWAATHPLRLERESRRECRRSSQASQPELLLEQAPLAQAFPQPTQAHRYCRQILQHEFWPESRPLTVLVQT